MLKKGDKLVIASHNKGKIKEIREMLAPFEFVIVSAGELHLPEPEETGSTFLENSLLKATEIMQACNLPCLADDSGLCVDALDGAPGVYSARWAQKEDGNRDFDFAFQKIFETLDARQSYSAQMVCVLTLAFPGTAPRSFEGVVKGRISLPPRGELGFGYDPIFTPDGYGETFAELDQKIKAEVSHRRRAFDELVNFFKGTAYPAN